MRIEAVQDVQAEGDTSNTLHAVCSMRQDFKPKVNKIVADALMTYIFI